MRDIIMDCKVGRFVFARDVVLSRAKLVRDSVMGQILSPDRKCVSISNADEAREFMREDVGGPASQVLFDFYPV